MCLRGRVPQQFKQNLPDVGDSLQLYSFTGEMGLYNTWADTGYLDAWIVVHEEPCFEHKMHGYHSGTPVSPISISDIPIASSWQTDFRMALAGIMALTNHHAVLLVALILLMRRTRNLVQLLENTKNSFYHNLERFIIYVFISFIRS